MKFTVPMALVDYIPVVCFLIASLILQRDLYNKMSKGAFAVFSCGTIYVFIAGFLKATYKLLYAAGICDFTSLNTMFFPTQSIAFILAGLGILACLIHKQGEGKIYSVVAPAVYSGTMLFVGMMVVGLGTLDACLCMFAKKLQKKSAIICFIISFVFSLMMGYLSSKNFDKASMNWIAEAVNSVGQASLLVGTLILHKAGLKDLQF